MFIAKAVRAARKNINLTPQVLARRAEIPVSQVQQIESGAYTPAPATLKKVAQGLGFTMQQLLTLASCIQDESNELRQLGKELLLAVQPLLVQQKFPE